MPKARARTTKPAVDQAKIDAFAAGAEGVVKPKPETVSVGRTTISLPADLLIKVEDLATKNKRSKADNRTVSAIVRAALEQYMK